MRECHIFGDNDDIAWDLGNPDDAVKRIRYRSTSATPGRSPSKNLFGEGRSTGQSFARALRQQLVHPMKGPMTTQTLRAAQFRRMHWRGDRANGVFGINAFDSNLSFNNFIVAFEGLIGGAQPTPAEMQKFTDFQLQVVPLIRCAGSTTR